ncbi:MAG: FMN-binding protein [Acidobacteriota bacterium]|jgi:hypothetical protein
MLRWATCSRTVLSALLLAGSLPAVRGGVLLTQEEALEVAFPGCAVERIVAFLDPDQVRRIEELGGTAMDTRMVVQYRATREGALVGTAYFDAHRVRTLPETIMVVVGPDDRVLRIDVLSFDEPPDYLPRPRWFEQFQGRELDPELSLDRGIRGVTGATLSSRAVTAAVRRILAAHRVLLESADGGGGGMGGDPP